MQIKKNLRRFLVGACAVAVLYFLTLVFRGNIVLPQKLVIGNFSLRYYGLFMALAVLTSIYYLRQSAAKFGFLKELVDQHALVVVIVGFVFARLYHVASSFAYYLQHPLEALFVWNGGLSIYGATLGGFLAILYLVFVKKINLEIAEGTKKTQLYRLLDWLVLALPLGQAVGRLGNLFNYEAFGYPTSLAWKMFVPASFRPLAYSDFTFFHPFFLYEALLSLAIFYFLFWFSKRQAAPGGLFWWYILLYNAVRMQLELLRIDSTFIFGAVRLNYVVSGILVLVALFFLLSRLRRQQLQ